jgi:hypothetical protein
MYTAIVLDEDSRTKLEGKCSPFLNKDWKIICHHMTINMGEASEEINENIKNMIGEKVKLKAITLALDEQVIAVGVDTHIHSSNKIKHITIAVNYKNGGKPFFSNNLTNWEAIPTIELSGTIEEVG